MYIVRERMVDGINMCRAAGGKEEMEKKNDVASLLN